MTSFYDQIKDLIPSSPILVADDDNSICALISLYLKNAGFKKVDIVNNGIDVLERLSVSQPSCLILDIEMPLMDGREVLDIIRKNECHIDLPIIVITGNDRREERNEILRLGASNLISKPIDEHILVERLTSLIERRLLISQLSNFHDRLTTELKSAADMQKGIIPNTADIMLTEKKYNVQLANHFRPSSELGGDAWFLQHISDSCFGLILVDFSGHGISAAMNTFRFQAFINQMDVCGDSPAQYLQKVNRELVEILPADQFCTMLYAKVDTKNDYIIYSAAAAPTPIFGYISKKTIAMGNGRGLPLGIKADAEYEDHRVDFPKDSFLFLYSDALYETETQGGIQVGSDGIERLIAEHVSPNAHDTLDKIIADFDNETNGFLTDDLTAVLLTR